MNESKRRIIRAWTYLLVDHPVKKIRIDDILEKAEVSRDTFYYYFDGIANMPIKILECETDEIYGKLDAIRDEEKAIHEMISFFKNRRMMLTKLYDSPYREHTIELADTVALKLARVLIVLKISDEPYKRFACEMLAGSISTCIRRYMEGSPPVYLTSEDFPAMLMRYADSLVTIKEERLT